MTDEDMTTPSGLRIVRESEHAQIIAGLKDTRMVLDHMRGIQVEQGATLDALAVNADKTATATMQIATLNAAREAREVRREQREDARADRRWAIVSDNWRWIALAGCAILAPELVPRLVSAWGG